jgi:hypothetical protein
MDQLRFVWAWEVPMVEVTALWLPVLVSAVFVFVASSIIHMALPWHKNDYRRVPDEAAFRAAAGAVKLPPGDYMVPRASSMKEMGSEEFVAKLNEGPVMVMTVMPNGPMAMGASLTQWFLYSLVVSVFAAYVAGRALGPDAHYLAVFRFAGVTAFCSYALGLWPMSIWYKRSWWVSLKSTIDGLVYGLLTAGVFGWLWPR